MATGIEIIEQKLGVRPVTGGQHPGFGTHNALFRLSDHTYFEIIAPDPALAGQQKQLWMGLDQINTPGLIWWAAKVSGLEQALRTANAVGWELGPAMKGSRITADGTQLQWQLSDPFRKPTAGVLPFLIDWGDSPHPCDRLPEVDCRLTHFELQHPQPEQIRTHLRSIGLDFTLLRHPSPGIRLGFATSRGDVYL